MPLTAEVLPFSGAVKPMTVGEIRARMAFSRAELQALRRLLRQTRAAQLGAAVKPALGNSTIDERPISRAAAADFLGVSGKTVDRMLADGRLRRVAGFERPVLVTAASVRAVAAGG